MLFLCFCFEVVAFSDWSECVQPLKHIDYDLLGAVTSNWT